MAFGGEGGGESVASSIYNMYIILYMIYNIYIYKYLIGRFSNFNFTKLEHWKFLTVTVNIGILPFIKSYHSVSIS